MSTKDKQFKQACSLFESFRDRPPRKIKKVNIDIPTAMVVVGYVEFVGYKTTHSDKVKLYKHDFAPGSRPLLCSSPNGKQLFLLGGRFKFGARGIVDMNSKGEEVNTQHHGKELDNDD